MKYRKRRFNSNTGGENVREIMSQEMVSKSCPLTTHLIGSELLDTSSSISTGTASSQPYHTQTYPGQGPGQQPRFSQGE